MKNFTQMQRPQLQQMKQQRNMAADLTELRAAIAKLTEQATKTKGTEASAKVVLLGMGARIEAAVTAAIQADDNIDNSAIAPIVATIHETVAEFANSADELGAAIPANP